MENSNLEYFPNIHLMIKKKKWKNQKIFYHFEKCQSTLEKKLPIEKNSLDPNFCCWRKCQSTLERKLPIEKNFLDPIFFVGEVFDEVEVFVGEFVLSKSKLNISQKTPSMEIHDRKKCGKKSIIFYHFEENTKERNCDSNTWKLFPHLEIFFMIWIFYNFRKK